MPLHSVLRTIYLYPEGGWVPTTGRSSYIWTAVEIHPEGGGDLGKSGEITKRDSVTRVTPRILYFYYFVMNVQFEG